MFQRAYVLVEGHGEVGAAFNLLNRLSADVDSPLVWAPPLRWLNLHQWESRSGKGGLKKGADFIRSKPDVGALLILRDEDDACPKDLAPQMATRLQDLDLGFPVAYVLLHPEYEVLFLPCLEGMIGDFADGRPGLVSGTRWDRSSWEARRGVKEWLSKNFPKGKAYKPSLDQLPMTRKIDFDRLRQSELPCFGSLERGIQQLTRDFGRAGSVYPKV